MSIPSGNKGGKGTASSRQNFQVEEFAFYAFSFSS